MNTPNDVILPIIGLKISLAGISISIAATALTFFYGRTSATLQNILGIILLIAAATSAYVAFKIKVPKY